MTALHQRQDQISGRLRAEVIPDALDRLVELYRRWGKPDQARRWQAERAKYGPESAPPPRPAEPTP